MSRNKDFSHMHKDLPNSAPRTAPKHAAPVVTGWEEGSFLRSYPPMPAPKGLESLEAGSLDE